MSKELETTKPEFLNQSDFDPSDINIDINDIKMSQLKLVQSSDNGDEPGNFIDSVTKADYGTEINFIVVKHEKKWMVFNDDSFALEKSSIDGIRWEDGTELNEDETWRALFQIFYVLIPGHFTAYPLQLSFSKTSAKEGKKLLNFLNRFSRSNKEPIYARTYTLQSDTQVDPKKKKKYYVKTVTLGDYVTEEQYKFAKEVNKMIKVCESKPIENQEAESIGLE